MAQIQETTTVTIDDKSYEVASFSDNIKQMIALMDSWRQKDADMTNDLLMVRAAIRDIQNTLLTAIKEEVAPAPAEDVVDQAGVVVGQAPAA